MMELAIITGLALAIGAIYLALRSRSQTGRGSTGGGSARPYRKPDDRQQKQ